MSKTCDPLIGHSPVPAWSPRDLHVSGYHCARHQTCPVPDYGKHPHVRHKYHRVIEQPHHPTM
eukprot:9251295-Karenia_brevis.AAC.1